MHAIDEVLRATHHPFELRPMLWRFDQFAQATWREHALCDAAKADIVVIASTSNGALPEPIDQWIGTLITRKRGSRLTLVAILGEHDTWTISIEEPAVASASPPSVAEAHELGNGNARAA
jgi:hypothetical protein